MTDGKCPKCKKKIHQIQEKDFLESESIQSNSYSQESDSNQDVSPNEFIAHHFRCSKCHCEECLIKEVAITEKGLVSKSLNTEQSIFLFVSCVQCGFVEVYNADVLSGRKSDTFGTTLDFL